MKIKLTEEQYNRLLVENDKKFLDGKVEFPHIGNKVNKFIVKLFNYIHQTLGTFTSSKTEAIWDIITRDFGLTDAEAEVLRHYYANFSHDTDINDFSEFIGADLEYYGEFKLNTRIPVTAYMSGTMDGYITGRAKSVKEFIKQIEKGDWEDIDSEWNDAIESYPQDAEWDIDTDYAYDSIADEVQDTKRHGDIQDLIDRIEIM